ncbi:MAG: tetratricopeptide repeat protein [Myxococcales bacterium]|nr:tetratricopeptide repeat protein [Myxococcales bacterium]
MALLRSSIPLALAVTLTAGASSALAAPRLSAKEALKRGDALVLVGSYERAVKAYRQSLTMEPKNDIARVRLAHCLWRLGKSGEAVKLLAEVMKSPSPAIEALRVLSDIYLERKDYLNAAAVLEKLAARRSYDLELKLQLADAYRKMADLGNPEPRARALKLYDEVLASARDEKLKLRAREAGLTMRYGEAGKQVLAAKALIADGKSVRALKLLTAIARKNDKIGYLHYLRGMAYLTPSVDDRKKAQAAFKRALPLPDAALQLGVIYYQNGDLTKAQKQLEAAAKANPRSQRAFYHLGLIHREEGRDNEAKKAWMQAIRIDSKSAIGRWAYTKYQVLTGRIRALAAGQVIDPSTEIQIGKKTCERIEKRWPVLKDAKLEARLNHILAKLLRHSDRPKRDLRYKVVVLNVPLLNAMTVPNGKIYFFTGLVDLIRTRMGDTDNAYAMVLAHEISHNVLKHTGNMIKMMSTQKKFHSLWQLSKLMGALSRAHEYEADQYGALYAYRAGYDPSQMITLHQKMLQHRGGEIPRGMSHPRHKERISHLRDYLLELRAKVRHFKKGNAALKEGKYGKAVDHYELFLGVFPDSSAARNNLAVALHRKALMATKAAPVYRRSTDIDPNARIRRIRLRSSDSDDEERRRRRKIDKRLLREAIGEYAMVLRKHPRYARAYSNIATALSDLGKLAEAQKKLEKAIALEPTFKPAHNNLGVVLAQQHRYRAAALQLAHAVKLDAKYAEAYFNLGLVYEKLGDKPKAIAAFDKYVTLDATSGWATIARARAAALK